jgi:hypothetical protein
MQPDCNRASRSNGIFPASGGVQLLLSRRDDVMTFIVGTGYLELEQGRLNRLLQEIRDGHIRDIDP